MTGVRSRTGEQRELLNLLRQHPEGLTLAEIMRESGWTRGSALQVAQEARHSLRTAQRRNGKRSVTVYRAADPETPKTGALISAEKDDQNLPRG